MSDQSTEITVRLDEERSAYVLTVDGVEAGVADVELHEDRVVFTHTVIGEEFGGRGLAKLLVGHALEDVAERGLAVEPQCSFVAGYLAKNPDAGRLAE